MNPDHPEIKAQLYGGDIADYYKFKKPADVNDNTELSNIYDRIRNNKLQQFRALINKNPDKDNKPGI